MRGRPRRISRQKFPKRTRILSFPSKPYSFHSFHSAIGSRMNGMIFRSFRKWNSSQKNTNTVYSKYSYSGIVPKERTLRKNKHWRGSGCAMIDLQKFKVKITILMCGSRKYSYPQFSFTLSFKKLGLLTPYPCGLWNDHPWSGFGYFINCTMIGCRGLLVFNVCI